MAEPRSPVPDADLLNALQEKIASGQLDIGTALRQAASSGSTKTLELVLQLPNAKDKIDYVLPNRRLTPLMAAAKKGSLGCVKLLLYHGANLFYGYSNVLVSNEKAWHVAKREKHFVVEKYLKDCSGDYQKFGTSRAVLELTVKNIASNPSTSASDVVTFLDSLRNLVNYCKYDINSSCDEEGKSFQPLLLRAVSASNSVIAARLLSEFNANPEICDPITGENILHICLKTGSKLRFHFTVEYPFLVHHCNNDGCLPLPLACEQEDTTYLKWLFKDFRVQETPVLVVPSSSSSFSSMEGSTEQPDVRMSRAYTNTTVDFNFEAELDIPASPTAREVLLMKPFVPGKNGKSMLHILAEKGFVNILSLIVQACNMYANGFDLSALCVRQSSSLPLPIEDAINGGNLDCVVVLIDLAITSYQLPALMRDNNILKVATLTNNIESVKALIKFGFHAGIDLACILAATYNYQEILRLLLLWKVSVHSYREFSNNRKEVKKVFSQSSLIWKQLELQVVDPCWLRDASNALKAAATEFTTLLAFGVFEKNCLSLYQELGENCVRYFESGLFLPPDFPSSNVEYTKIVQVNLSENHLEQVPPALFQLASLTYLNLKYNKIKSLPTSSDYPINYYSAKLDTLCLDYNELTHLPNDMMWGLAQTLTYLSVQKNSLEELPPGLWVMPNLKTLKLAKNRLSRLHYLSNPFIFKSEKFTTMASSVQVRRDGSLVSLLDLDPIEAETMFSHIKNLANLLHTVYSVHNLDSELKAHDLLSEVVQLLQPSPAPGSSFDADDILTPTTYTNLDIASRFATTLKSTALKSSLILLDLSYNNFTTFPWDLPCLAPNLGKLELASNAIECLDIVQDMPMNIGSVDLTSNKITSLCRSRPTDLPCGSPTALLTRSYKLDAGHCKHCRHEILEELSRLNLDNNLLNYLPLLKILRSGSQLINEERPGDHHLQSNPLFPELGILSIASNRFSQVPEYLHHIKRLSSLDLSHNDIQELPEEMGLMNLDYITYIKLDGIHLRNIPPSILKSSAPSRKLVKYLKDLKQRAKPFRYIKLMLVGDANKGKTSLLLNLMKKGKVVRYTLVDRGSRNLLSTVGVDLGEFTYSPNTSKPAITFMTWDFGGQEEYYATHQCFLTKRSLYLLVWNIQDGQEGLRNLKVWLQHIESCAPEAPVMIIATHLDLIAARERDRIRSQMEATIKQMYSVSERDRRHTYPTISAKYHFLDVHNAKQIDNLRDEIYAFIHGFNFKSARKFGSTMAEPLLEKLVPESYTKLHKFVRELAEKYQSLETEPVLTKTELIKELTFAGFSFEDDFEEVSSFLHENGTLLHFEDSTHLSDLYFIDPQWLCKMVAKMITIGHINPYVKKGFMWTEDVARLYSSYAEDFTDLLRKFEVVYQLDKRRIVIPSLLPVSEDDPCFVYSRSLSSRLIDNKDLVHTDPEGYDSLGQSGLPIYCRYYLLPFIPKGFFTRFIARLMSSDIIDKLQESLKGTALEAVNISNAIHWSCWRTGIVLVWNRMEIFRVAPLDSTNLMESNITLITSRSSQEEISSLTGLEIKVALIPTNKVRKCAFLEPALQRIKSNNEGIFTSHESRFKGQSIAAWLLFRATSLVDSTLNDWYEGFGLQDYGDPHSSPRIANFCSKCLDSVPQGDSPSHVTNLYMFSSTYCCLLACKIEHLVCPCHGRVKVEEVAPDLVFGDLHPATVFSDHSTFELKPSFLLGKGGYGSVYKASYQRKLSISKSEPIHIAMKTFTAPNEKQSSDDDSISSQLHTWSMYCKVSDEVRVMNSLAHKNILGLIGVCFQSNVQLSVLIELAPKGDLRSVIEEYKKGGVRVSRRIIKATLIQLAEAMEYLHLQNIIYRDLKPQNVLVWKFPEWQAQWSSASSVHVKIADYGISSVIGPDGIRGGIGSEPYQAPEVVIFGGRRAYSFEVDVYAFGMCIYFLVSLQHPFSKTQVISVALREGRRPHIPKKMQPWSISFVDLMCWCWSSLPQDRPNFAQIIQTLKMESFTNLLAATEIVSSKQNHQITASCLNTVLAPPLNDSQSKEGSPSMIRLMSLVRGKSRKKEEQAMQLVYGTGNGHCEVLQYQATGIMRKTLDLPVKTKEYISCIKMIAGRIWIATVGKGLFVYDASTFKYEVSWGDRERQQVYSLLNIEETGSVLALTADGIFSFEAEISKARLFDNLEVQNYQNEDFGGLAINAGVVIPPVVNVKKSEVWVCSHAEKRLFVLNPYTLSIIIEVEYTEKELAALRQDIEEGGFRSRVSRPQKKGYFLTSIKDLRAIIVNERMKLGVADNWLLLLWDVETRALEKVFDFREYCKKHLDDNSASSLNVRIASLEAKESMVYAGLESGLILCIDCTNMQVTHTFNSYKKVVSSLMMLRPPSNQPPSKTQESQQHTNKQARSTYHLSGQRKAPPMKLPLKNPSPIAARRKLFIHSNSVNKQSFDLSPVSFKVSSSYNTAEDLLLISIGKGYEGIVGSHTNHPKEFTLPSAMATENHSNTQAAKPHLEDSYLLIWSTEKCAADEETELAHENFEDSVTYYNTNP